MSISCSFPIANTISSVVILATSVCVFFILAVLMDVKWYHQVWFVFLWCLMKLKLLYLMFILCIFLGDHVFRSFDWVIFLISCENFLNCRYTSLIRCMLCQYFFFFHFLDCPFYSLGGILWSLNVFNLMKSSLSTFLFCYFWLYLRMLYLTEVTKIQSFSFCFNK